MPNPLSILVPGVPAPQGSKNQWGGEDNPRTRPWREAVTDRALDVKPDRPLLGAVNLAVEFVMPRPKCHFRTGKRAHELKDDAPAYCSSKPDLDKLQRAICDALTVAGWWRDDAQVVSFDGTLKRFANVGETPHAAIYVAPLDERAVGLSA